MTGLESFIADATNSIAHLATETLLEDKSKILGIFPRDPDDKTIEAIAVAAQKYARFFLERYGTLYLLGGLDPVMLESFYTDVEVWQQSPTESLQISNPSGLAIAGDSILPQSIKKAALEAIDRESSAIVFGGPGSGKSTLFRKIGLEALRGKRFGTVVRRAYIPAFIEMKAYSSGQFDLEKAIADKFRQFGFPSADRLTRAAIAQGRLLILLDDVHKVPMVVLDETIADLEDFVRQYPNNRYLASSRPGFSRARWRSLMAMTLAELDDDRIQALIRRWFVSSAAKINSGELMWAALQQPENASAKTLARTPLLLTLLCLVYDRCQKLPGNRALLYTHASNILLEESGKMPILQDSLGGGTSHSERISTPQINRELTKLWLSQLAFKGLSTERFVFSAADLGSRTLGDVKGSQKGHDLLSSIPVNKHSEATSPPNKNPADSISVNKQFSPTIPFNENSSSAIGPTKNPSLAIAGNHPEVVEELLTKIALQSGILAQVGAQDFVFSHQSFQEYFTAIYIDIYYLSAQISGKYLTNKRWQEVFLFLAGVRQPTADKLLLLMEAAAQKYINTGKLRSLLGWANEVTSGDAGLLKSAAKRAGAIFLVLALECALVRNDSDEMNSASRSLASHPGLRGENNPMLRAALDLTQILGLDLTHAIARARVLARELAQNLAFACSRPLDVEPSARELTRDLARKLVRDRARELVLDLDPILNCYGEFALDRAKDLAFARILARLVEERQIFKDLAEVTEGLHDLQRAIPETNAPSEIHEEFRDRIRQTWLDGLDLKPDLVKLSTAERVALTHYFYANWIVVRSYQAAAEVTPATWKVIEGRMVRGS